MRGLGGVNETRIVHYQIITVYVPKRKIKTICNAGVIKCCHKRLCDICFMFQIFQSKASLHEVRQRLMTPPWDILSAGTESDMYILETFEVVAFPSSEISSKFSKHQKVNVNTRGIKKKDMKVIFVSWSTRLSSRILCNLALAYKWLKIEFKMVCHPVWNAQTAMTGNWKPLRKKFNINQCLDMSQR